MKKTHLSLLPLALLVPLALASHRSGEKLSFQPKPGESLGKHFAIESEVELEDMTMEMNGQDMTEQAGQVDIEMKMSMKLSVTDQYDAVGDGRPNKLKRSFDEISSTTHMSASNPATGPQDKDVPATSKLEGTTVVFSWDDGASTYDVAFDGDAKGDKDLLENLEENLDLRGFLPGHDVAEGDTWKVPAEAVRTLLAPGGDVKLHAEEGGDVMGGMDQLSQSDLIGDLEGTFDATYSGTREEDGVKVAVIKLKIETRSARDMSDRLEEMKSKMQDNPMQLDISSFDTEFEYEAEGELLWNQEAGLVHGLQLSGDVRMIIDMSMSVKMGDNDANIEVSQTYTGNRTVTLTTSH